MLLLFRKFKQGLCKAEGILFVDEIRSLPGAAWYDHSK
jgi:hypothetical protein